MEEIQVLTVALKVLYEAVRESVLSQPFLLFVKLSINVKSILILRSAQDESNNTKQKLESK